MRVVVAIPAAGLLTGAALGLLLPDVPLGVTCTALVAAAASSAWAVQPPRPRLLAKSVCLTFLAGGVLLSQHAWREAWRPSLRVVFDELAGMEREDAGATDRIIPEEPNVPVFLTGRLRADAASNGAAVSLSVDVLAVDTGRGSTSCSRSVRGGLLLTVVGQLATTLAGEWRAGRLIRVPAQLHRPSRYLDPGVPDDERALARRGTTLVGTIKSGALVEVLARGSVWAETASGTRAVVRRTVSASVGRWSPRAAAIVRAIVIGDRAGLDQDVQQRLQRAGTYHVIAISGGNIAILAGLTLAIFRLAGVLGRGAMLSAIAGLTAYSSLVGGGASVDRATLMATVYLAARAMDLRGPPFNALVLVAALLVAADPLTIADPAFVLTFGATLAILTAVPLLAGRPLAYPIAQVVTLLVASVAAEAALFPVSALLFSRVTFAGLLLNFAAIPLMAIAQVAGMLVIPATLVSSGAGAAVGWIAFVGAEGLVRTADLVEWVPFVTWRVAPPHWIALAMYYAALVAAWSLFARGSARRTSGSVGRLMQPSLQSALRLSGPLALAVWAGAALWILSQPWAMWTSQGDGRLHVTFIDVGQGDAALVQFPRGATLLVDTGGLSGSATFDIGARVVAPVLRRAGVRHLDTIALTHGDADHVGGANSLIDEFRPREIWEGIAVPPFEPLRTLRLAARHVNARWTSLQAGDLTTIEDVEVRVLHPPLSDWERQDVRNDDSIVLELRWGDASIVLTGDIGREVEGTIARLFASSRLRVVKVPHHGSLTSSSSGFVQALAPRAAVVSVGRANTFGHPAAAVLGRYRDVGAEIFRTDRDGAVTVTTDGVSMEVRSFMGRRLQF